MLRPWIGVCAVVLGAAALPCSAMAQTAPDTDGPAITITSPASGHQYTIGEAVVASYSCTDPSDVADCAGSVPSGSALDTSTAGPRTFTVTAHDKAGNSSSASVPYSVVASDDGGVGGTTPATLNLTLGTATPFAPFIPGVAHDYFTSVTARILATSGDAALSVADPSSVQTGHLVNGTFFLSSALEAAAAKQEAPAPASTSPVGGNANPTTLLTYDGPVNETATVTFKQPILATDALRTGAYAKTLTFTLSTTQP
jgi:hypothetical protein